MISLIRTVCSLAMAALDEHLKNSDKKSKKKPKPKTEDKKGDA
jgi:hypothetical protein